MKIRALEVNKDNWAELSSVISSDDRKWNEVKTKMEDVGNIFKENIPNAPKRITALYSEWLRQFSIDPFSRYGWWSYEAIDPDNIVAFIEMHTEAENDYYGDSWPKKCYRASETISRLKIKGITLTAASGKVREIIETVWEICAHHAACG